MASFKPCLYFVRSILHQQVNIISILSRTLGCRKYSMSAFVRSTSWQPLNISFTS